MMWHETVDNLFGAYVNQGTLEDAAEQMVFVSSDNPEYHELYTRALDSAIDAAQQGDTIVIDLINRSGGYRALDTQGALELLAELRKEYIEHYQREMKRRKRETG